MMEAAAQMEAAVIVAAMEAAAKMEAPGIGRALQEVNVVHAETLSRRTFPLDAGEALNRGMGGLGRVEFHPPPASANPSPFSRLTIVSL